MKKEENLFEGLFEGINNVIKVAGELGKFAEDTLKKFYSENKEFIEFLSEITPEEFEARSVEMDRSFNVFMIELGYPPVSDLDGEDFLKLYEAKEEKGVDYVKKYIDDFMLSRFNEQEILKTYNEWCKYSWIRTGYRF